MLLQTFRRQISLLDHAVGAQETVFEGNAQIIAGRRHGWPCERRSRGRASAAAAPMGHTTALDQVPTVLVLP